MDDISDSLQKFENYVNLNYMAFSKILKKHDKFSTCHCRMPYLMKIQVGPPPPQLVTPPSPHTPLWRPPPSPSVPTPPRPPLLPNPPPAAPPPQSQIFLRDNKMNHIVKSISDMRASLEGKGKLEQGAQMFDPDQKGGASFVRRTTKYWVRTKDVLKV